ncbi:MAG: hypothetical protein LUG65_02115, partial [Clostridiales bacterium]|nr:hypothetical protein [Clostridiales bacterium]
IFPCSAFAALNLRTTLADVDIDNVTRAQKKKLPSAARDTLPMVDKLVDYDAMHLEQYSTLSPSAQRKLNYRLSEAEDDTKEQALIHSGICSVESAITAYVKKYAKTKKVKDLVETFQEVLTSNKIMAQAKEQVATSEEAARACAERAAAVQQKIADGKEAAAFKARIAALDPMPVIEERAEQLSKEAGDSVGQVFNRYGDIITSRDSAQRLVKVFSDYSTAAMARLTAELENTINTEIVSTSSGLLAEYQEKLEKMDESSVGGQLDFQTVDLIKGELQQMRENTEAWASDDFAAETVEAQGETTYDERTYYEKVGQEEEEVVVGSHQEKIGTKKVWAGSHKEKVGTRTVRNPNKRWWKLFAPKYVEEDVYETVDDYKDEDVYETVLEYKTIMRDIFEQRVERIEKFSVETGKIQQALMMKMRKSLDDGIKGAKGYAEEQVESIKAQFSNRFDQLDELILAKYDELNQAAGDAEKHQKALEENRRKLAWLEDCIREIDSVLDM